MGPAGFLIMANKQIEALHVHDRMLQVQTERKASNRRLSMAKELR
jgi:hypothetical protein